MTPILPPRPRPRSRRCRLKTGPPQALAESQARLGRTGSQSLDLRAVRQSRPENQAAAARARIMDIRKSGDIVLATHALTFPATTRIPSSIQPSSQEEPPLAIRGRRTLRTSMDTFLAKLGQRKAQLALARRLRDQDPPIRMCVRRVPRDIEPEKLEAPDRPLLPAVHSVGSGRTPSKTS